MIIFLDAGHGGKDPGAVAFGVNEKDVVLSLVHQTKKILETKYENVDVILTRSTDQFIDLSPRSDISNKHQADIFISFHNNAAASSEAHGFETFIYNGNVSKNTISLQNHLHGSIMKVMKKHGIVDRGKKKANYSVLRETNAPACLIEFLFITNPKENGLLKQASFLQELAIATAQGIAEYANLKEKKQERKSEIKPEIPEWKLKDLKELYEKGFISDYNLWASQIDEPAPNWLVFILINRILSEKGGN